MRISLIAPVSVLSFHLKGQKDSQLAFSPLNSASQILGLLVEPWGVNSSRRNAPEAMKGNKSTERGLAWTLGLMSTCPGRQSGSPPHVSQPAEATHRFH